MVRFGTPSAESETKTQAGSVGVALLERKEQFSDLPAWETAAFILNLDAHALGADADAERDRCPRPSELAGVLQEIADHRRENLPVRLDHDFPFDGQDIQADTPCVCVQESRPPRPLR